MQKGRKKQAKYPFGVMKEERKKEEEEDEDEKQELEFAEGFRRIKNTACSIRECGKVFTFCVFGQLWNAIFSLISVKNIKIWECKLIYFTTKKRCQELDMLHIGILQAKLQP